MTTYDRTGVTYSVTRRPDARIAAVIDDALQGMESVVNIGAGGGSYETPHTVVAVEPSRVMIDQRPGDGAPAVQALAEHLPIGTDAVDAVTAILTVHHWTDLSQGVAEMLRIARRRVVVFTWENTVFSHFWLLREYLPAAAETDARLAVPIAELTALLGDRVLTVPVPVPHDCVDGIGGAYWRRPHVYLERAAQDGMSLLALTPRSRLADGLSRLREDLDDGSWHRRHADLLERTHLDLGYRLLIADTQ